MESKGVLAVILLILIFTEGSHAFFLGKLRIRASKIAPKEKPAGKEIPPSPSPMSMPSLDSSHLSPDNSTKARPKGSDGQGAQIPQTKTPSNQSGNKSNSPVGSPEGNCADTPNRCTDKKKMIACLKHSENGSLELFLLVQNDGEDTLKTNVIVPASIDIPVKQLEIPKHQTRKIKISVSTEESLKIVLNAGNGQCVLHMGSSVSDGFFQRIPAYANLVTPIHGVYFLFLISLIVGGTWACCKLGERRHSDGVPYQELEMGLPESVPAVDVETADGWDQGWDDDWDEEKAVKSVGGNGSLNGITSKSSDRDGWENGWDD